MIALLDWLAPIRDVVPATPVNATGAWTAVRRATYASQAQFDSGAAPTGSLGEDLRWTVEFTASEPIVAIAFFESRFGVRWAKSNRPSVHIQGALSLTGWTTAPCTMMASAYLHGALSDGIPIEVQTEPRAQSAVTPEIVVTGVPTQLAHIDGFSFVAVVLPAHVVQFGRNGLWHLRAQPAARLPDDLRVLFTRRRCGRFASSALGATATV